MVSHSAAPLSGLWPGALGEGSWALPRPSGAGRSHEGAALGKAGGGSGGGCHCSPSLRSPFSVTGSADLGLALPAAELRGKWLGEAPDSQAQGSGACGSDPGPMWPLLWRRGRRLLAAQSRGGLGNYPPSSGGWGGASLSSNADDPFPLPICGALPPIYP